VPTATVDGLDIDYELIGDGDQTWVVTPGGRYSKDYGTGIRETARALADRGRRVLIWDRPNTGASSVCFRGPSESAMQADALAALLRHLELPPAIITGGSGGARVSLLTVARHPNVARACAVWWVSGGVFGTMSLGPFYCGPSLKAAWISGMQAVAELADWREVIERNPANRDRILEQDRTTFIATMERWMSVYYAHPDQRIPGMPDADAEQIGVPTLVFRSGPSDVSHTRQTSEALASLIPSATLIEPPWGDDEWNERVTLMNGPGMPLFENWPRLVPALVDWADSVLAAG
jgi:pimeloyl-ACP methyl ester carboxylesterase